MKPIVKTVASQPSWILRNTEIELAITQLGGHLGPVNFYRNSAKIIQPYYISPWQNEKLKIDEPVLVPLRGDFFCMPFGADNRYRGEDHRVHGDPATKKWNFQSSTSKGSIKTLTLEMKTKTRPGTVTKRIGILDGSPAVYCQHILTGYNGPMSLGHHATLALDEKPGSLRVATSAIKFGMTAPGVFSDPANREYQSLASGTIFTNLSQVPTVWAETEFTDCTSFPNRLGYTDLAAVYNKPSKKPAWTTATRAADGYLWFSLKDPAILPATALWISNRGRHAAPWNGRNLCLGLEDGCGYFANGLRDSAKKNCLNELGVPTVVKLSKNTPTCINYIQGVVKIPRGFKVVKSVKFAPDEVIFTSASGKKVSANICHNFIKTGEIE